MTRWTDLSAAEIATLSARNRASRVHKADSDGNPIPTPTRAAPTQPTPLESKPAPTRAANSPRKLSRTRVSESTEQRTVVFWWDTVAAKQHGLDARHLIAIPNGGARDLVTGAILKAEGARAGVPDLFLAVPIGPYHGLWPEMKALDGHAQPHQRDYHALLRAQGYAVAVCKGAKHAQEVILRYLAGVMV